MWELDHKEGWALKNWCFLIVVLEKTLESPSDSGIWPWWYGRGKGEGGSKRGDPEPASRSSLSSWTNTDMMWGARTKNSWESGLFISCGRRPGLPPASSALAVCRNTWMIVNDTHTHFLSYFADVKNHPLHQMSFPRSSAGKVSTCNAGDLGLIPELERSPGGGLGNPLQYSCLENHNGQRSLAAYSP